MAGGLPPAIAGRKNGEGVGVAVGGADVLFSPLPAARVAGLADDVLNGGINIDLGVAQLNLTVAQQGPGPPGGRTASRYCPS